MSTDLDKLREVYLTGVDEETKGDNLDQIREWEKQLTATQAYRSWREHDFTKTVMKNARETYRSLAVLLATKRDLSDEQRKSIYARQDAMQWLLSLADADAEATIKGIHADIRRALSAVS